MPIYSNSVATSFTFEFYDRIDSKAQGRALFLSALSQNLKLTMQKIIKFLQLHEEGSSVFRGKGHARDAELAKLKHELAWVKKERNFLKEAVAFFARDASPGIK